MKALVYTAPRTLEFREVASPAPRDGDVLLRVEVAGICGSDMHGYLGHDDRRRPPLILGHEAVGTTPSGERMVINPLMTCLQCEMCASGRENLCGERKILSMTPHDGAFADYVVAPRRNLIAAPDSISSEKAALIEPLACGWHAVRLALKIQEKPLSQCRCLVLGGGMIGLGGALVLAAHGAGEIWIAEKNPIRHAVLAGAGDFSVYNPDVTAPPGRMDVVIDAVGVAATRRTASQLSAAGGVIVHIGLGDATDEGLDARYFTLQEVAFTGTYTYTAEDFRQTAAAVFAGELGGLDWFEVRALKDGGGAFEDILAGKVAAAKIILKP